jgi:NTP pyrophosphatase (non-canonical NTP hydrolase)
MAEQLELFSDYDVSFDKLIENVINWAADKDILKKENAPKQLLKVLEEVGETAGALLKSKDEEIKDGIGDSFVTLIILAKQLGLTPSQCLEAAWNEIKDRTGKTVNGVFVKN